MNEPVSRNFKSDNAAPACEPILVQVKPAAFCVTQATEWGTVYAPDELGALAGAAARHVSSAVPASSPPRSSP